MEKIELYKNVIVYRGLLTSPDKTIDFFEKNNKWRKWFTFGKISDVNVQSFKFDNFPTDSEWDIFSKKNINDFHIFPNDRLPESYDLEIIDVFYKATKDYIKTYDISLPNWKFNTPSTCMYKTKGGASDEIAMHYHTDYQQEKAAAPGDKFGITCTMYLNDNYEGGEIVFRAYDKDNPEEFTEISHKPIAGDVLVFPSGDPYYHAVKLVTSGEKYFIRSFWQYEFPGTDEWLANQQEYGAETWAEMEKERERAERSTGQFQKY
jgi:hypothetical protein